MRSILLLASIACSNLFPAVCQAAGVGCKVEGLTEPEQVIKAIECVRGEMRLANDIADDLKLVLDNVMTSFKQATEFAVRARAAAEYYQETKSQEALVNKKDWEALYWKAYINFQNGKTAIEDMKRTKADALRAVHQFEQKIRVLQAYEKMLKIQNPQ